MALDKPRHGCVAQHCIRTPLRECCTKCIAYAVTITTTCCKGDGCRVTKCIQGEACYATSLCGVWCVRVCMGCVYVVV